MRRLPPLRKPGAPHTRGVALIIVLAFIVLLTGLVVAFFSRSLSERQISNGSAAQVKVDLFTQGAIATITSDLKQEIAAGSNTTYYVDTNKSSLANVYLPTNPTTAVPALALKGQQSSVTSFPANLVKRSAYKQNFFPGTGDVGAANYNNPTVVTVTEPTVPGATPAPPATTPAPTPTSRAADLSSTLTTRTGRSISPARWNKALLLPKKSPTDPTDNTPYFADPGNPANTAALPQSKTGLVPPDWVLVARDGTNPGSSSPAGASVAAKFSGAGAVNDASPSNVGFVTGRYAYTVYDEGGLLDANVAGYPTTSSGYPSSGTTSIPTTPIAKASLAYADLTTLIPPDAADPSSTPLQPLLTAAQVNTLVGWRNYASSKPGGTFPTFVPGPTPSTSPFNSDFDKSVFANLNGFMGVNNVPLSSNNQSDRMFGSRQELINFFTQGIPVDSTAATIARLQGSLQYFGTFSRGLNQPSYAPVSRVLSTTTPNPRPLIQPSAAKGGQPGGGNVVGDTYAKAEEQEIFSPSLLNVRVQVRVAGDPKNNQGRSDGTDMMAGEPLVKSRFALQRLAWLTYVGPSAEHMTDQTILRLINDFGFSKSYLLQGNAQNIKNYFGLTWDPLKNCWRYNIHNGGSATSPGTGKGAVMKLPDIADQRQREPDFFELLKASADAGALAKAATNAQDAELKNSGQTTGLFPLDFQFTRDIALDAAVIQLGANIIDQYDLDGYSTHIIFDDGGGGTPPRPEREFRGVENLPYIYRMRTGSIVGRPSQQNGSAGASANAPEPHSPDPYMDANKKPVPAKSLTDTGVGVILATPDIWNPHDQNSSMGNPRPNLFQMVADSTDPDNLAVTSPAYSIFSTNGYVVVSIGGTNVYKGGSNDPQPPGVGPYRAGGPYTPKAPSFSRTPTSSGNLVGTPFTGAATPPSTDTFSCPQPINATTGSTLTFQIPLLDTGATPGNALFREPTMLAMPGGPTQLAMKITNPDAVNLRNTSGASVYTGGGFKPAAGTNLNPLGLPNYNPTTPQPYCGLYLGCYPLRWVGKPYPNASEKNVTSWVYAAADIGSGGTPTPGITYRLQYTDQFNKISTYDEKYINTDTSFETPLDGRMIQPQGGAFAFVDPRTSRFGSPVENNIGLIANTSPQRYRAPLSGNSANWLDPSTAATVLSNSTVTERPGLEGGFGSNFRATNGTGHDWGYYTAPGWHYRNIDVGNGPFSIFFQAALFSQNDPYFGSDGLRYPNDGPGAGATDPQFYSDPDGVVRRAMGAYTNFNADKTPVGQPLATASSFSGGRSKAGTQSQSRPMMLNRPFRSTAELGYVFSGTPWKNVDFSTPESGYSEMLDVFCVNDNSPPDGLVAGKVSMNTRQPMVLKAVLSGAYADEEYSVNNYAAGKPLDAVTAEEIAKLLVARTSTAPPKGNAYVGNGPQPLQNIGDLVGRWTQKQAITYSAYMPALNASHNIDGGKSYDGLSGDLVKLTDASVNPLPVPPLELLKIARLREAGIRALSNVGNARVWNLMIDVIAQSGRYASATTGLKAGNVDTFIVDGEQRCWVHLAIDRYTGAVLDTKIENVKE